MKTKTLAGTAVYWIAVSKSYLDEGPNEVAFRTRARAVHWIDHRTEGWDGWRLLQVSAFAEHWP